FELLFLDPEQGLGGIAQGAEDGTKERQQAEGDSSRNPNLMRSGRGRGDDTIEFRAKIFSQEKVRDSVIAGFASSPMMAHTENIEIAIPEGILGDKQGAARAGEIGETILSVAVVGDHAANISFSLRERVSPLPMGEESAQSFIL